MSWTEVAIGAAEMIARRQGCELASFSLEDVDIYEAADGTEVIMVKASCQISSARDRDDIPWEVPVGSAE
jgi:hypothetical protein